MRPAVHLVTTFALVLGLAWPAHASDVPPPAPAKMDASPAVALPTILSPADRDRYRRIFSLQAVGKWRQADKLIKALENRLLLGHVLYQRYMHPTAYRSRYRELKAWLRAYRDHPGASRIYRLAMRRRGRAAPPPRPLPVRGIVRVAAESYVPPRKPKRSRAIARRVAAFEKIIARELRRQRPGRAEKRYWAIERIGLLAPFEASQALGAIAESYFRLGNDEKARALGAMASDLTPRIADRANWAGGLAAWRLGDCDTAMQLFARLSASPSAGSWQRAAGGFWAARAALVCHQPTRVETFLRTAAQESETFYGILAARQLGIRLEYDWSRPSLIADALAPILTRPAVRRAIALVEVGESFRADAEFRLVLGRSKRTEWRALSALAAALRLPASQLRIARAMVDADLPAAMRYPLPDWEPAGGFVIDRALLFAVIRQESEFSARARSHVGASGLMQVMPATASYLTGDRSLRWRRSRLYEPEFNMALGQSYIAHLAELEVCEGNLFMLAAAYNAGPGNLARWRRRVDYRNDPLLFIEAIPARETRNFIERVMTNLWLYRLQLGQPVPSLDAVAMGAWPIYERLDDLHGTTIVADRDGAGRGIDAGD